MTNDTIYEKNVVFCGDFQRFNKNRRIFQPRYCSIKNIQNLIYFYLIKDYTTMRARLHFILIASAILFTFGNANAQSASKLKAVKHKMDILDYQGAIMDYNQILTKHDNTEAKVNLAECYRKVSDTENAEYWYGQVVMLDEAQPEHWLYYGYMLQRNGKCDLARPWFEKFVEARPDDTRGRHLLRACDYEEELLKKNDGIYTIEHMPFNTGLDDFSPMYYGDGLVFASESADQGPVKRLHCWTGNPFLELMYVKREEKDSSACLYDYGDPEKLSAKLNTKYHDAVIAVDKEDNKVYFTRNNLVDGRARKDDEGVIRLKILSADVKGSGENASFSNIESLPFNSDEYSVAHPALTPDGKFLYFASDMPGGFGGMDLYVSESEDGRWGPPINLGPKLNTEGHEVFPFFAHDGNLYYASDGHVGLGGLDIYHVKKKEGFNEWGDIINIGAPINSVDDDFSYIINEDKTCGYFTSDREGGFGDDDIYSFRRDAATLELFVYDEKTGEPIEGAMVINDCTGEELVTDAEGKAYVEQKLNQCCNFAASKDTYDDNTKEGCTEAVSGETILVEIPLSRPTECFVYGNVSTAGTPLSNVTVMLTPECGEPVQETFTDNDGNYKFELKDSCCYEITIDYDKNVYLNPLAKNVCTMDDEGRQVENCDSLTANFILKPHQAPVTQTPNPQTGPKIYEDPETGDPIGPGDPGYDDIAKNDPDNPDYYDPNDPEFVDNYPVPDPYPTPGPGPGPGTIYPPGDIPFAPGVATDPSAVSGDPLVCCGVYENLTTSDGGTFEVSPSVTDNFDGGAVPYLLHIYYDFDQSYIRTDAESELRKLMTFLSDNPDIVVEIGSHTDSRGSNSYNNRLSQRRSESVVRWLKEQGVDGSRLQAAGYGEAQNVNNCANEVPCSEQEHQLNRRTEFKVVGLTDGTMFSKPRDNVRGQGCEGCPF